MQGIGRAVASITSGVARQADDVATVAAGKADLWAELQGLARPAAARQADEVLTGLIREPKAIAKQVGQPLRDVLDGIHAIKNDGKFGAAVRNPDVLYHPPTGELYPMLKGGKPGPDSYGNLLEWLGIRA